MIILNPTTKNEIDEFIKSPFHALGLYGKNGAGKTYIAEYIAKKTLNQKNLNSYPYSKSVDASQEGGIEFVRDIQSFLTLRVPGPEHIKRAVIISHADHLGHEAQNALLKMLEEPPADTIIILTASSHKTVLPTIDSRLRWMSVNPISIDQAKDSLSEQYNEEDIRKSWMVSQGYVGLLLNLLDESQSHPLTQAIQQAKDLLRSTPEYRLDKIDEITKNKDFDLELLLEAIYKLIHASLQAAIEKNYSNDEVQILEKRLELVVAAQKQYSARVQPKLVLTNLFYSL